MNELLLINASPRRDGTSAMLCKRLQRNIGGKYLMLYDQQTNISTIIDAINVTERVVLVGCCYINSYPSRVTLLLEELSKQPDKCHGQKLYGVINGGMPYVHTHESGLHQLEIFADLCNMHYAGGMVIGLGPILNGRELEKHLGAKKLVPAFQKFTKHVQLGEDSPASLYRTTAIKIPAIMAMFMAKSRCKSIDKELASHGFDYNTPSPYRLKM